MPFNGAGVFSTIYSWVADAAAGIDISASRMDAQEADFATAFDNCITRDGQGQPTGNQPMANFRHTGASNGVALTDYSTIAQLQNPGPVSWGGSSSITGDAITVAYSPPLTTLVNGQLCFCRVGAANTITNPTFSPDGLTPRPITKFGGAALAIGEYALLQELILRYNLANSRWELLNPTVFAVPVGSVGTAQLLNSAVTYAKIQNVTALRLIGNPTGAPAAPSEIVLGSEFSFSGASIVLTTGGTSYAKIQNVAALRIVGNPTGAPAALSEISLGAEFSFSGASIILTAGGTLYSKIQNVTASRLLGNPTGGPTAPSEISLGTGLSFAGGILNSAAIPPTTQVLTAGTGATYTTPAGVKWLEVLWVGGGSGGGGGNNPSLSTAGGATSFGTFTAAGGAGSGFPVVGAGGTASGGYSNNSGNSGSPGGVSSSAASGSGGTGGASIFGGGGAGSTTGGIAAPANSGAGGGGGGSSNGSISGAGGSGGASGGWGRAIIAAPAATYAYTIGAGGAGAAGSNVSSSVGSAGAAGGSGRIEIIEHY